MTMQVSITARKTIIQGLKLAAGTILAVALSKSLGILSPYATGTIALITLLSSKWETMRLTLYRLLTYFVTVAVSWGVYRLVPLPIVAFGLIMAVLYWLYNAWHLLSTLAVNGVICSHFMTYQDFSPDMILHEFLIVLIGVLSALLINQFYTKRTTERALRAWMAKSDQELVAILERIANHLDEEPAKVFHVTAYEESLTKAYALARDFEENTFSKHTNYYVQYFKMRLAQCHILKSMLWELRRMPMNPKQSKVVTNYIRYLSRYILETNAPLAQQEELEKLMRQMKDEPLPATRQEFESRAYLMHILLDLEEFVACKQHYIDGLSEKQKAAYWRS
ncbi:aromatic acid exporter family protein [uncultured Dubosiella sp.]|uniref:aromatic acid exporter family protein n=1 Tax=uncultured Dubosiella sp. TaxID=1937011 RepID=UPI0025AF22C1|nr:aromatic acid exporter family protein [uncultured Dubosiella sp.]